MPKQGKLGWYFKDNIRDSRNSINALISSERYTIDDLLSEVNNAQLWKLVEIFRDTEYWWNFLIALLRLSPEIWTKNYLCPEDARHAFTAKEKNDILALFAQMVSGGKHSPLLLFL